MTEPFLHPDRLFSSDNKQRDIARSLYQQVKDLPIVSPHGHTDPRWFADNTAFSDASSLLIQPDHYLFRMLYSQGVSLERLGFAEPVASRNIWRLFAAHYHLFQGTPSRIWFDHALSTVFAIDERLHAGNADTLFDCINEQLAQPQCLPRALFDRFNIELLATTESALDDLQYHDQIAAADWSGRVVTTYRPDSVVDPDYEGFAANIKTLGQLTATDTTTWQGYLMAHRVRRAYFIARGATATDHGHPTAMTADLSVVACEQLYAKVLANTHSAFEAELFRGQLLTEMAAMSLDDALVMQIHPGVHRNHNASLFKRFGRDKGADLPATVSFTTGLKPLLDRFGNNTELTIILFTLDETTYSRELAPLAGHYPALKLGPAWWFFDSPEGMLRHKRQTLETAGFYNTAGFNDDTRAFLSIPARHDVARRIDCRHLAELVSEHRITEQEAFSLAFELAVGFARKAYGLG